MDTDVIPAVVGHHRTNHPTDQVWGGEANGIRERDGSDLELGYFLHCLAHLVFIPRIAVRIPESHGDIDHHVTSRFVSFLFDPRQNFVTLLARPALVLA